MDVSVIGGVMSVLSYDIVTPLPGMNEKALSQRGDGYHRAWPLILQACCVFCFPPNPGVEGLAFIKLTCCQPNITIQTFSLPPY
jgi:hypothetical protein